MTASIQEISGSLASANLLTGGVDEYFQRTDSAGARSFLTLLHSWMAGAALSRQVLQSISSKIYTGSGRMAVVHLSDILTDDCPPFVSVVFRQATPRLQQSRCFFFSKIN